MPVSLGVDVGSISTKGVLMGDGGEILAGEYIWTKGDPVGAVKHLLALLQKKVPNTEIRWIGTTGSPEN